MGDNYEVRCLLSTTPCTSTILRIQPRTDRKTAQGCVSSYSKQKTSESKTYSNQGRVREPSESARRLANGPLTSCPGGHIDEGTSKRHWPERRPPRYTRSFVLSSCKIMRILIHLVITCYNVVANLICTILQGFVKC